MIATPKHTSPVLNTAPRCSAEQFAATLIAARSPWASQARELYDLITTGDGGKLPPSDPAFWLGVARREHRFGTDTNSVLHRNDTNSWTNARSVRHPDVRASVITDPVRGSEYVRYASVADSLRDGIYRLVDPEYRYAREGRATVEQICAIWTEDPGPYTDVVLATITQLWWGLHFPALPVRVAFIPYLNRNRPRIRITDLGGVTVHSTGNPNRGANAEMHRAFTHNGGGDEAVSFTFTNDDTEIVQLLPFDERGVHAGSVDGNAWTHAIERCINSDGDPAASIDLTARLIAALRQAHGVPYVVFQHWHWSGKECPRILRSSGGWDVLLDLVARYDASDIAPEPAASDYAVVRNGHTLGGGFLRYWLAEGGLAAFGEPIDEEHHDLTAGCTVQNFERARFEHRPNLDYLADHWHVQLGRVNAELIDAVARIEQLLADVHALTLRNGSLLDQTHTLRDQLDQLQADPVAAAYSRMADVTADAVAATAALKERGSAPAPPSADDQP